MHFSDLTLTASQKPKESIQDFNWVKNTRKMNKQTKIKTQTHLSSSFKDRSVKNQHKMNVTFASKQRYNLKVNANILELLITLQIFT